MLDLELGRTKDYMKGIKIGLINIVKGSYKGLFIGGINNIQKRASNKKTTVQLESGSFTGGILGLLNNINHELNGIEIATLYNYSQDLKGSQISLFNIVNRFLQGNQTGVINYAFDSYNSLQIGAINYSKGNGNDFPAREEKESFWNAVKPVFQIGLVNINKNYHRNQLVIQLGGYCQIGNHPFVGLNLHYIKASNKYTTDSKNNELI